MIYGKDQKRPTLHDDYTPQLMVKLIREIIAGLCYCHSEGVCHLDFKPENCLLAKEDDSGKWTAKIADFGAEVVRKTNLLRHFILKMIILKRQARDKHRENSKKRCVFRRAMEEEEEAWWMNGWGRTCGCHQKPLAQTFRMGTRRVACVLIGARSRRIRSSVHRIGSRLGLWSGRCG
jgi:serine/threonine protein kinase